MQVYDIMSARIDERFLKLFPLCEVAQWHQLILFMSGRHAEISCKSVLAGKGVESWSRSSRDMAMVR